MNVDCKLYEGLVWGYVVMCIAVPSQVISLTEFTAVVDYGGITQEVNTSLIENVQLGDYLLIHCGCAIDKLNQEEAERTIYLLETAAKKPNGGKEK